MKLFGYMVVPIKVFKVLLKEGMDDDNALPTLSDIIRERKEAPQGNVWSTDPQDKSPPHHLHHMGFNLVILFALFIVAVAAFSVLLQVVSGRPATCYQEVLQIAGNLK